VQFKEADYAFAYFGTYDVSQDGRFLFVEPGERRENAADLHGH
jgi:hypothetical protein